MLMIGIPAWWSECVMPVALALIAVRLAWGASDGWKGRAVAFAAVALAFGAGRRAGARTRRSGCRCWR